ncbi:iron-containing redox enzyme family protein [Streptosporangium sp. NPDC002544]|uniref:iron-containing redox enzyme family protein n=1 Tax=Streptosporangium sp. NPDC002544 TaxID=3154538 RepID=UPI0033291CD9
MTSTVTAPRIDVRALYLRALDPEGPLPLGGVEARLIDEALAAVPSAPLSGSLDVLVGDAGRWSSAEAARFRVELPDVDVARVLLNSAPLALAGGAWLQWMSSSANGDTELALQVLALYATDIGVGSPHADRGSVYRALLARRRVAVESSPLRLVANEQVETFSFRLPALLLAMSRLPGRYFAELLGADVLLRAVGWLPPLAALPPATFDDTVPGDLDLGGRRPGEQVSALDRSVNAAKTLLANDETGEETTRRLLLGFGWAAHELRQWCARLRGEMKLARHPDYDVWRLLFSRARQAAVYHGRYMLEGRPLAEWFADVDAGPAAFLDALAGSGLVRPGHPDRSPLLRGLIGEKGPMFRVFTEDELAVLRRWIAQLPTEECGSDDREDLHVAQWNWFRTGAKRQAVLPAAGPQAGEVEPTTLRDAYHALLTRTDTPGLRRYAYVYATRWLTRSRFGLNQASRQLPVRWDQESGLRGWLEDQHDRHSEQVSQAEDGLPTREQLIRSTLQLAPLIMIDGGWLQGFTDYRLASSEAGQFLFRTYWDELGNGDIDLNHPRIYRALLAEMGYDLPDTASPEFAAWPGFDDRSFALPVYWLSIARFPRTFHPEILGLNLAMELSGVGGSYRTARTALREYGFSTQFVDLHNTIDNVATGHSAWASDAIDCYLADMPSGGDQGQLGQVWERIRLGYRSLNPPEGRGVEIYTTARSVLATVGRRKQPRKGGAR